MISLMLVPLSGGTTIPHGGTSAPHSIELHFGHKVTTIISYMQIFVRFLGKGGFEKRKALIVRV